MDFRTDPERYKHWKLAFDGPVATLAMDVKEDGGLVPGYELKLNSYDLGVDIELYDAVQRLRFEHPEIGAVVLPRARSAIFCAGANIQMLSQSSHDYKVNFCKFTNETRIAIEDATDQFAARLARAVNGPCAGGGYELALACDQILLADDGSTTVSLPEVPLLAVLPGTGGLTRLVDKRQVRRDRADFFCTLEEGIKGKRAVEWRLVDEVVPRSQAGRGHEAAAPGSCAARTDRPAGARGHRARRRSSARSRATASRYAHVTVRDRPRARRGRDPVAAPDAPPPADAAGIHAAGARFWPLAVARELDDLILHLRDQRDGDRHLGAAHEPGRPTLVEAYDARCSSTQADWLVREIRALSGSAP